MKKQFAVRSLVFMIILFFAGVLTIFLSGDFGQDAGHAAIQSNGGSMGGESYTRIIDTTRTNWLVVGSIVSVVSGAGALLSGCALYKEL